MKYSMKRQLTLICTMLVVGTTLFCFLLNTLFLADYYTNKKKMALKEAYTVVNRASNEGSIQSAVFDTQMRSICGKYNLDMVVMDEQTSTVKASDHDPRNMVEQLLANLFSQNGVGYDKSVKILEKDTRYTIQIGLDHSLQEEYIEMWGLLDNGNLFLVRSSLEGIKDSASIANTFLAYAALGSILISALIVNYLSKKMTTPIMELAQVSSKMKELDFNAKYTGDSKTEIAILGKNINELSETLEHTISELKTANNELQLDLERKTKQEEKRKEFLSNVSHELKTPIALIQGYAEGLKEGLAEDQESRDAYLDVIMDEAGKMDRLVKTLMTLDQLETGNETVSMERFDLGRMIHEYLKSLELMLTQQNVVLQCNVPDSYYVWGDPFRIQEVLTNYLSNATHYVETNSFYDQKTIRVSIDAINGKKAVSVFNSGKKIPEESINRIWDKFYKVDKARTREYGGSGIGLSIVKAIMESMHQEYGVLNLEEGVEFFFTVESA